MEKMINFQSLQQDRSREGCKDSKGKKTGQNEKKKVERSWFSCCQPFLPVNKGLYHLGFAQVDFLTVVRLKCIPFQPTGIGQGAHGFNVSVY